jgi:hypothetical protein
VVSLTGLGKPQWRSSVLHPRFSLAFGCLVAALAISILAIRVPYYAIFASAALVLTLVVWVVALARAGRRR